MKKTKIRTGIEIETILNRNIHNKIKIGEYHNGKKLNKYWKVERDSSLNAYGSCFINPLCCEFVSDVLKGKRGFKSGIEIFINKISKNNTIKLKEVLEFNKSCGCHLHIGFNDNKKISNMVAYEIIEDLRKMFFKELDLSDLRLDLKEMVKEHYFRHYAKEITNYYNNNDRYLEFNKGSERENKGFEWRSFNLYGVESWEEFKILLNIGYKCLEYLYKKRVCGYKLKKKAIRIKKSELKKIVDFKNDNEEIDLKINSNDCEVILYV